MCIRPRFRFAAVAALAAAALPRPAAGAGAGPANPTPVYAMAACRAGLVGRGEDGHLVILDPNSAPRPLPVEGDIFDVAGDGRRLWVLRLNGGRPEIDEMQRAWTPRRRAVCRFAAAELAFGEGRLWAGSFAEGGRITVQAFAEDGTPGPTWVLPFATELPLDAVEEAVLNRFGSPADVLFGGYELVALGKGAALVFRRRNLIVVLPASGGAPRIRRWPAIGRAVEEVCAESQGSKTPLPLFAAPMVAGAVGLGGGGLLIVEPWVEAEVTALRNAASSWGRESGRKREPAATLTWLSADGAVLRRWRLPWQPTAVTIHNGAPVGVDRGGRLRKIGRKGLAPWAGDTGSEPR